MSDADTLVWTRDASWWNRPDTRTPKKFHREHDDPQHAGMAACSPGLVMLYQEGDASRAGDVSPSALCGRCFPNGVSPGTP